MGDRSDRRRYSGVSADAVSAKLKHERSTHEGQHGQVIAPTPEAVRGAIEAGQCPWCGRGPYKLLAGHTNKCHGIDKYELRELAGLMYHVSICDPELAATQSENAKRRGSGGAVASATRMQRRRMSTAGREALRQARLANPEQLSAAGKVGGPIGGAIRGEQMKKPRKPCVVCGNEIPFICGNIDWKTCSPECRTANKARVAKEGRAQRRSDSCKNGHPLSGGNLKVVPHGNGTKRVCLECQRASQRRYRARKAGGETQ